jgi:hypothetical protein
MTDTVLRAKQAREKLSSALSLMQSPAAGTLIDTVAEPIAQAMGALHGIESSGGQSVSTQAPAALDAVRKALGALQQVQGSPEAEKATELIAGSLGVIHGLAEAAKSAGQTATQAATAFDRTQLGDPGAHAAAQAAVARATAAQAAPAQAPAAPAQSPTRDSKHAAPPEQHPAGAVPAEANLGAHSPTNFYKGLSGNDVVDDGGLFIATYEIPRIGTKLWVTVNMPGGYDFQALAEVKWTRESGMGDAPPGYGCAFESISDAARKLIYRYVKNREPLFHDDL